MTRTWLIATLLGLLAGCQPTERQGGGAALVEEPAAPMADARLVADKTPALADKPADKRALPKPPAGKVSPYVIHMPGVSGTSIVDYTLRDGMKAAGFDGPFEIFDWTCGDPGIPALRNRKRNDEQAKLIAEKITKQFRAHPEQPIYVTCHSGGVGPAVWALEKLPADVKVHSFVMLGPAISPTYDLSKALAHVTDKAYYYWSPADDFVLGTGTKLFGTIDGQYAESAGKVAFEKPAGADDKQYAKLVSRQYESGWAKLGNVGGHIGWMAEGFVKIVVAPALTGRAPTEQEVEEATKAVRPMMDVQWPRFEFGSGAKKPEGGSDVKSQK
ncbi:MAG TPA: hypothetical protein VK986_01590 [Tepidisphaeraceae bacterium]|nr:hypothetical protein [Tepidisphaeraceae bacterium]